MSAVLGQYPAAERPQRRVHVAWGISVAAVGALAAAVAVTVTLQADFLAYPAWLALQKADLILGPIGVGLYWRHVRPHSRFGPMLVGLGIVHVPYIAQSSANDVLFTFGVHWEGVIYLATLAVILAFPSGRLDRTVDRLILVVAALGVVLPSSAITLLSRQIFAGGSISACKSECPENALVLASDPSLASRLFELDRAAIIAVSLGTAALLLWRLATGTRPQRRALAIGTPIALVFLLLQATYQLVLAFGGADLDVNTYVRWTFGVARSALWYGFLVALVAAQLFAARVLRRILAESLHGTSPGALEALLRRPLGDPQLRLAWWGERTGVWAGADGNVVAPPAPGSARTLTVQEREGGATVGIVHDVQLTDDPELVHAAGAVALLVFENAELKGARRESLRELRKSRARLVAASANERRRLERDLHDGAQQRLLAIQIELAAVAAEVDDPILLADLRGIALNVAAAVEECRMLAQGLYPTLIHERGLGDALRAVARTAGIPVAILDRGIHRHTVSTEEAVYFCVREAIQNATKHAGAAIHVTVELAEGERGEIRFAITDDGAGFRPSAAAGGLGLANMRDRIAAVGGRLEISSEPGHGTTIRGAVPDVPALEKRA
jgi:signal transduction histidine kinase